MRTALRSLPGAVVLLAFPLGLLALALALGRWTLLAATGELSRWWLAPLSLAVGALGQGLSRLRRRPDDGEEVELTHADAPALWQVVDGTARALGAPTPRRILLDGDPNASVTRQAQDNDLVLGLAVLAALTTGQLRAVVAHELGHLIDAPTSQSRSHAHLERLAWRGVASTLLVRWWAIAVLVVHGAVDGPRSRRTEHLADTWSLRAATRHEAIGAQHEIFRAVYLWEHVDETYVGLFHPAGLRAPVTRGYHDMLQQRDVPDLERSLAWAQQHDRQRFWDSHPATRTRIAHLQSLAAPPDAPTTPDPRPALDLVPDDVMLAAEGRLLCHQGLEPSNWATVADVGGAALLVDEALGLARYAGTERARRAGEPDVHPSQEHRITTYADLLDALHHHDHEELTGVGGHVVVLSPRTRLPMPGLSFDGAPAEASDDRGHGASQHPGEGTAEAAIGWTVQRCLAQVAALPLVDSGVARVAVRFPEFCLRRSDGSVMDLDAALSGSDWEGGLRRLRQLLESEGVDLGMTIGSGRPLPEASLAAATWFTGPWPGHADLVITTRGLIALPAPDGAEGEGFGLDPEQARALTLATTTPARLRALPGAWELPVERIERARVTGRVTLGVVVRTTDGAELELRSKASRSWLDDDFARQLVLAFDSRLEA